MIDLRDHLVATPQREIAGSRSSSAFAYQKNWALSELIEYHINGTEYVFAFEFHDDVLILDSEKTPKSLTFVQVKTNNTGNNWTIRQLTKSVKGQGSNPDKISIIGKLYENRNKFDGFASELKFVTNAHYSFNKTSLKTVASSLSNTDRDIITSEMESQLGTSSLVNLNCLSFERSSLSSDDHETHIRGKLNQLFDKIFGDKHSISVSPWYQSISDQIKLKNDYPPNEITTFDEFIKKKCITKSEIDNFIFKVKESINIHNDWSLIESQLQSEGYDFQDLFRLKRIWRQYTTSKLDYSNRTLESVENKIKVNISSCIATSLHGIVDEIKVLLDKDVATIEKLHGELYIDCMIIWVHCENI